VRWTASHGSREGEPTCSDGHRPTATPSDHSTWPETLRSTPSIVAASTSGAFLPADTEARLTGFTELVGTALANTEAQAALTASRARIVAAAGRRIERDLHDGAQQRQPPFRQRP
jgi:hypothetical protein